MSRLAFSLRYAARSLARDGQRTALALACVAFGVLAYTGTVLLTRAIDGALLIPAAESLGGDLEVRRTGGRLTRAEADAVAALARASGARAATPLAPVPAQFLQVEGIGRLTLVSRVLGVDPGAYPVVGPLRLRDGTLAEALAAPDAAVVTRDLARTLGLAVGDRIKLAAGVGAPPLRLVVRGVADQTPDRVGSTVYVPLATAAAAAPGPVVASVLVAAPDPARVVAAARAAGWDARQPTAPDDGMARAFGVLLPAAGLLGLLLGGVGVATTVQVTLARRRDEIATLKALGYTRPDLVALFATEAALLGAAGSALGVLGGLALGAALYAAFSGALPVLVEPAVDGAVLAQGLVAGVATTVLFALAVVVRASAVRPAALLRRSAEPAPWAARAWAAALGAALLAAYGVLAGGLVGSLPLGLGVVALGAAGLVVVGGGLVLAVQALARAPVGGTTGLLARRSLARRPLRTAASLAALFTGVLAVALAAGVVGSARSQVDGQYVAFGEESVLVAGTRADRAAVERAAPGVPLREVLTLPLTRAEAGGAAVGVGRLEGRALADGLGNADLTQGRLPRAPREALAPEGGAVAPGDTVRVETGTGRTVRLAVVGLYGPRPGGFLTRPEGLLVSDALARRLGTDAAAFLLRVPDADVDATADRLGRALPDAAVLTGDDVNAYLTRLYEGLFVLVLSVAGLAFGAGALLVANAVTLALVERRHELAVFKAVGYTARRLLALVAVENAVLGAVAGGAGAGLAVLVVTAVSRAFEITVWIEPGVALGSAVGAAALAAATAAVAAAGVLRVRPADALRSPEG